MSIQFIQQSQYLESERSFELVDPDSMTIPNQDISAREILIKFNNGTLPNISKIPIYELDNNSDDFDAVDPTKSPDYDLVDAQEGLSTIEQKLAQNTQQNTPETNIPAEEKETQKGSAANDLGDDDDKG